MKTVLIVVLASIILFSMFIIPAFSAGAPAYSGRIVSYQMNSTQVYAFIPDGLTGGRRGAGRANNTAIQQIAPVILVYGDEPFTEASALQTAYDSGLAEIAAKEEAVISFINPKNGATWSADDVGTYASIVQNKYVERPAQSLVPVDGVYPATSAAPGGQFAGFFYRTYVVAEGSGADFAAQYLMDDTLVDSRNIETIPASLMLFNTTAIPSNKAGLQAQQYPTLVVNGTTGLTDAVAALNLRNPEYLMVETSANTDGFDSALLAKAYRDLTGLMVRPQMSYSPLPNSYIGLFKIANNMLLEVICQEFGYTSKAVTGGTVYYDYYVPRNINKALKNSVPLVMVFHGSGETSEYIAKMGAWLTLANEEGFMVVSVDNHGAASLQHALLDELLAENPFLDPSRIYVSGFSMGAAKAWQMIETEAYARKIAGVTPWAYLTAPGTAQTAITVPVFYAQGWWDTTVNWPTSNTSSQANRIRQIFNMNKIGTFNAYTYVNSVNQWWGINGDNVEKMPAKAWIGELTINSFVSADGEIYTKLVDASNFGHGIASDFAPLAWDFLKNFVRNDDGSVGRYVAPSYVSISGPDTVVSGAGATVTYTISAENMPMVSAIDLEFEVDGDFLSSKGFTALDGFSFLSAGNYGTDFYWTNVGNKWIAKAILLNTGGNSGNFNIVELVFNVAEGKLGDTDVKLNYAKLSFGGEDIDAIFGIDTVTTAFEQWFSPYDLNKDGVVDLNDVTYALQFMLAKLGDLNWDEAKAVDFSGNDVIDIDDLVIILANYTVPYYA